MQFTRMQAVLAASLTVFVLLAMISTSCRGHLLFHPAVNGDFTQTPERLEYSSCQTDLDAVRRLIGADLDLPYAKTCIRAKPKAGLDTSATSAVDRPLFGSFESFGTALASCEDLSCEDAIVVEYADQWVRRIGHPSPFLVGADTTIEKFDRLLSFMARWLAHTDASVIVRIHGEVSEDDMACAREEARAAGMRAVLINDPEDPGQVDFTTRNLRIVDAMRVNRKAYHKWFVIIDDDMFSTSLLDIEKAIEPFDPAFPWYIGPVAGSWPPLKISKCMAFGGAGIIISLPVLDLLSDHMDEYSNVGHYNDVSSKECLNDIASPPLLLSHLAGPNQIDTHGNPDRWFKGERKPGLRAQSYEDWHRTSLGYGHLITELCGHDCFLQRYLFQDGSVLINGHSAVNYPRALGNVKVAEMENISEHGDYQSSFRKPKSNTYARDRTIWKLEFGIKGENGVIKQFYVQRGLNGEGPAQSVLELEWAGQ